MTIRNAENRDAADILRLLVQVNNVHSVNRPDLFLYDKTKYTLDELTALMADPDRPIFVAVNGEDRVLGYAFCVRVSHEKDNNFPDITTLYVDDICVDEAERGCGVATALFEHVKRYGLDTGCYNITLNVWDKNEPAIAFYHKCGFGIQKYGMELIL